MAGWLRRAGRNRLEDGRTVIWSVAEGRRGRRWRELVRKRDQPGIRHSLLLEMDSEGRFSHLELSTEAGLLTLHPEADGTLHGNSVTDVGIEHIRGIAWDPDGLVIVDGSLISRLAAVGGLRSRLEPGSSRALAILRVPRDLRFLRSEEIVTRRDLDRWALGEDESLLLDDDGFLRADGTSTWPLEESD